MQRRMSQKQVRENMEEEEVDIETARAASRVLGFHNVVFGPDFAQRIKEQGGAIESVRQVPRYG